MSDDQSTWDASLVDARAAEVVERLSEYYRGPARLRPSRVGEEVAMRRDDAFYWSCLSCIVDVTRRKTARHHTVKLTPVGHVVVRMLARLQPAAPILPCPFCASVDIQVEGLDDVFRCVECNVCGARGPREGSEDEDPEYGDDHRAAASRDAIAAWNAATRPRPPRARAPR